MKKILQIVWANRILIVVTMLVTGLLDLIGLGGNGNFGAGFALSVSLIAFLFLRSWVKYMK
jgi:hypothetical protein